MIALNAHYDGKVIVPDEPLDLPPNQKLRISIETVEPAKSGVDLSWLLGMGNSESANPSPRFTSNDDLWDKTK